MGEFTGEDELRLCNATRERHALGWGMDRYRIELVMTSPGCRRIHGASRRRITGFGVSGQIADAILFTLPDRRDSFCLYSPSRDSIYTPYTPNTGTYVETHLLKLTITKYNRGLETIFRHLSREE